MSKSDTTQLDEVDLSLLKSIEEDFDVSLEKLAGELDLSKSAVHYRLDKLKNEGIIENITADINPEPFGLEMVVLTEVSVTHEQGYSEQIGKELSAIKGVNQVYYTMGDVDFITVTRVQNREQMNEVIESMVAIRGVNETSSRFVMSEVESTSGVVTNMSNDMREIYLNRHE